MLLRQLNIAPRAALGFALIAVLVALLGVFALGQMSSIRDSEVAVENRWLPSIRGGDEIRELKALLVARSNLYPISGEPS